MMKKLLFAGLLGLSLVAMPAMADTGEIYGKVVIDEIDSISASDQAALYSELVASFPDITLDTSSLEQETKIEIATLDPTEVDALIKKLSGDSRIQHVEHLYEQHIDSLVDYSKPNDPLFQKQWNMVTVNAQKAWGISQGEGAIVSVVDTGVDQSVEDLASARFVTGFSVFTNSNDATDKHGHGTHVSGTIAQQTNNGIGVAGLGTYIRIMPVQVLNASGSGTSVGVADGIRWAADHGANVINMSLGGGGFSQVQKDAVDHALSLGVFIAAANGNDSGPVNYPAKYPGVFAVSATDEKNNLASFSSYGPETGIGAPGTSITQETICGVRGEECPAYLAWNGTSMATPHVAGIAGLLVASGVTNPEAIKDALRSSATTTDQTKANPKKFGAGIANAGGAVSLVFWKQVIIRLLFLQLFGWFLFRGSDQKKTLVFRAVGLMVGVGAFFLVPLLNFPGQVMFALTHPLVELTSLYSVRLTSYFPLANLALPGLLMVASWHWIKARMVVVGACVGVSAYLASLMWSGSMFYPLGSAISLGFMAANIFGCMYLGRFVLRHLTKPMDTPPAPDTDVTL